MEAVEVLSLLVRIRGLSNSRKYGEVVRTLAPIAKSELRKEPELAIELLNAWLHLHRTEEGIELTGYLLRGKRVRPLTEIAQRTRLVRSSFLSRVGRLREAQRLLEICQETCRWEDANSYTAEVHNNIGIVLSMRGKWESAVSELRRALAMYQQLGHRLGVASACHNLGMAHRYWGRHEEAEGFFMRAAEYYREEGIPEELVFAEAERSLAILGLGDARLAELMARRSVVRCSTLDNPSLLAETLRVLGTIKRCTGDFIEARRIFAESYRIGRHLGNLQLLAELHFELGLLHYGIGADRKAKRHLRRAAATYSSMGAWGYVRRIRLIENFRSRLL